MQIRLATRFDYPAVKALVLEIQRIHAEALPTIFAPPHGEMVTEKRYQQVIAHPNKQIWVAWVEKDIVGYIYAELIQGCGDRFHLPRSWIYVHQLAVHPDHRHQGYGQALLEAVVRFGQRQEVDRVEVEVWNFNTAARSLYQKFGFRSQSERMELHLPQRDS